MALVSLVVNGQEHTVETPSRRSLLSVLRERTPVCASADSCERGSCRACTVLVNDQPVLACQTEIGELADAARVLTIDGVADGRKLHPLQDAFLATGAYRCEFCAPGMIIDALVLLRWNPDPTESDIRRHLAGHLCHCRAYPNIIRAIQMAARQMRGGD